MHVPQQIQNSQLPKNMTEARFEPAPSLIKSYKQQGKKDTPASPPVKMAKPGTNLSNRDEHFD
jgi:hypothetical protein